MSYWRRRTLARWRTVGAEEATVQRHPGVRVLLDLAGHPFCLYTD